MKLACASLTTVVFFRPGLPPRMPLTSTERLGRRAEVELVGRLGVVRDRARIAEDVGAGRLLRPARALLLGDGRDPDPQRLRHAAVAREDPAERLRQGMDRVHRRVAVHPRVQVALAGAHADVEGGEAAGRDRERRQVARFHAAVEDHARVGAALVLRQELDDRLAADLLLAVRDDADVDRKRALGREQAGGVQEHPELPLVVGHPARVQPLVADRRLERIRLPELERRRRLDVEMAVAEDRRGALRSRRGADLADDQRPLAVRHELRLAAAAPDLVGDPLGGTNQVVGVRRIGAHGLDAQQLAELVEPVLRRVRSRRRVSLRTRVPSYSVTCEDCPQRRSTRQRKSPGTPLA